MITAPFNFVPLNKKVFFPDWAESVSHDIPFEDGESGVIDITLTAKSPIFIRDHEKPEEFCQYNGEYYIPSTSVKGMVRNVLEIMSFSKMSMFNDDTYAVRDLSSSDNFYMKDMKKDTFCGWLKKDGDDYYIENCGIPGRIKHEEIDKALDIEFASKFKNDLFKAKDKKQKTSKYKYDLLIDKDLSITLSEKFKSKTNGKYDTREFYNFQQNSNKKAKLVCTGQPTVRKDSGKKGDGKAFEFLFFDSQEDLKVDKKVYNNFLFAYFDKRITEPKESPDWTYWKEKLESGAKIPVFFQKNCNKIKHFGLSYLYKLPYANSVSGGVPAIHTDCRKDLAETMFGYIDKDESLKGRIQFSHFRSVNNAIKLKERIEILGTPRASYYPIYVEQSGKLFSTFMDSHFSITGRKRYPIHRSNTPNKTENTGNTNVGTTFVPLKEGVVFKGKVRFHNLKKVELGALLSTLSFHNTHGCFHNLGIAKSLGYGKVELKIDGIEMKEYLKAFESEITVQVTDWINSTQLKELLSMAVEQNNESNSILQYMKLEEFAKNKTGNKDCLKNYTCLANIKSVSPKSLLSDEEIKKLGDRYKLFEKEQNEFIEKREYEERYKQELEVIRQSKNIGKIKSFLKKYPDAKDKTELEEKISFIEQKEIEDKEQKLADKHKEVNAKAQLAYDTLQKKKGNQNQYKKKLDKFVKKWSDGKYNKGSEFVLELVEKAKGN